jgi:hypothetical protein
MDRNSTTSLERTDAAPGVSTWPAYPSLYEINTWVWLNDLSQKYRKAINLSTVPPTEWDAIAAYGFDAIWFMGVWERSPAGVAIANCNDDLLHDFLRALPDFHTEDNVGSPYCVRRYRVDPHLGGSEGLAVARRELAKRGLKLILDFVPNHVAPDHPWVAEHPEYFIHGSDEDARNDPGAYVEVSGTVLARGRDPYFPAWPDVLQLNAFASGLRQAVIDVLSDVATQSDGVRCDMAMLFLNSVFERTWGARAAPRLATEYWMEVISAIKRRCPNFLFVAEAYWDLEWQLQQQGFDFCYDKRLYDRLEHANAESIRLHLSAEAVYQARLLRFIENHDEPRAATTFSPAKERAAAVTIATLPGMKLFHEGQFGGRKVKLPVFLGRRPNEIPDRDLQEFYSRVLEVVAHPAFRNGQWELCERTGWPDNTSFQNLLSWCWQDKDERYVIAVNFSDFSLQAMVHVPWADISGVQWNLLDRLSGTFYHRDGNEMASNGLFVELAPWNFHLFQCIPRASR